MKGCIRKSLFGVFLGVLGAAGATMLSYQWSLNVAATGLLQLLVVLLTALQVGFWEATLVSFLSCSCLWYFVIPPSFSLAIQDPQNWVALITFEISALLVSRLSARARNERTKAEQRRVEMEKLCELSLKLLFLDKGPAYGPQIVDLIQRLFSCEIVTLFDSASLAIHEWSSDPETSLKTLTRVACVTGQEVEQPETDTWVRLLRFHGRVIGALALRGKELSATATNALASLSSICMERARSFESESRAAAERRAEELRNAVLDALAHEFKTPLTVISTASNGLLAMDGLLALQRDKLSNVDHEAKWLNEMTTHVLRASRLEVEIARQLEQNSAAKTETANKSVGA